jgi:hypothetical protein
MKPLIFILIIFSGPFSSLMAQPWSSEKANQWYAKQPWLVGCNYIPANAINELEMWQAETFDPATIDKELSWAEDLGFNTLRVFLHDLLWLQDSTGFVKRINVFLSICEKHHIKPIFVLFDSVWDPDPKLGKQHDPKPGVHNSGWVQSPGAAALTDQKQYNRLKQYVVGVVKAFANDRRVLAWDIWNEPDNVNTNNYPDPKNKLELVAKLLPKAFIWARSSNPIQPITSGVWQVNYDTFKSPTEIEKIQLTESDIITFHNYGDSVWFEKSVRFFKQYKKPMLCTEYLARGNKSLFETIMPIAKREKIALYNWGFAAGKTQTNLPWDSWEKPYINGRKPAVWHHEIFSADGRPYNIREVEFIKRMIK